LPFAFASTPIPLAWSLPFVLLLAAIALMPFVARHAWERHYPKVSIALACLVAGYYTVYRRAPGPWLAEMKEYISFMTLLGALFVISGGIANRVNRRATPHANVTLLLIGAALANVFGTTGAAMLLIRPYLRMNRGHVRPYHVVFFIVIVAYVGGSLTPICDPPLFLGYLRGVPFWWIAEHMAPLWLLAVGLLTAVFFVVDTLDHRGATRADPRAAGPQVHVLGAHNFVFIGVVLYAVFRPGLFDAIAALADAGPSAGRILDLLFSREPLMLTAALASHRLTARTVYAANDFSLGPLREVAILFFGIFSTMVPALQSLEYNAGQLALRTPGQFYFASGVLSSVLDNAPTYLTFLQTRLGDLDEAEVDAVHRLLLAIRSVALIQIAPGDVPSVRARAAADAMLKYHQDDVRRGSVRREQVEVAFLIGTPALSAFVLAISAGSVFWGACTYIGNGPNFMVKSIAAAAGAPTPSFLEYVYKYTLPILLPVYILVWLVAFR
jgi:Na+/H+ antiporter NhaD/arsenite permease-like protein